ncbi:MAG: KpsF/GutQ family sugar-phosphate isomerase [Parvibaculales bacterium]
MSSSETALHSARATLSTEREGLRLLEESLGTDFEQAVELIGTTQGRLIVTGMGKSGHIAKKITATLASTGTPAYYVHPGEASHGDLGMIMEGDVVLGLSWSGETPELSSLLGYVKRFNIPLVAMTSSRSSALGAAANICLTLPSAPEACPNGLAPTTSTTMQLALGDALAIALLERRGFTASDFRKFHPGGKLGASLTTVADIMHQGDALPLTDRDTLMSEAIVLMSQMGFGCLGVRDGTGTLVGIITDGDLRRHMGGDLLDKTTGDIMTPEPKTITGDIIAAEALSIMNENKIQGLFICEQGQAVGFLHLHDLLRLGTA